MNSPLASCSLTIHHWPHVVGAGLAEAGVRAHEVGLAREDVRVQALLVAGPSVARAHGHHAPVRGSSIGRASARSVGMLYAAGTRTTEMAAPMAANSE
ncbi:hypothetical protein DL766_008291 [Monosporascus sp. MC13-8B]|uniref:Uncharacterized protein n=1 Tax=Monosporascus cannonballus TaxID=155416 RepID=A0ABY0GYY2_9PEZI|nr:hypothetical protein DL762_007570 [Monosporascus cannonballus]RYO99481.1 hypothetical protein DL763_001505 [Monosporascus cannonballus]RYP20016.1 hypothetical protein DL766_008291 [Monosporascus sp. MC13-8B]